MKKSRFVLNIIISDFLASVAALYLTYLFRFKTNFFDSPIELYPSDLILPAVALYVYWLILYLWNGLYSFPLAPSRTDENFRVLKTTFFGIIILFLITFDLNHPIVSTRLTILIYWIFLTILTSLGRIFFITLQRKRFERGIGLTPTLIVGYNDFGFNIYDKIVQYPALGYKIVGFVSLNPNNIGKSYKDVEVIGDLDKLPDLIRQQHIGELVIAFDTANHERLLDVVDKVGRMDVGLKIIPDMYDIISGQARTNQIYGFPLIDIFPQLMPQWEKVFKRLMDIGVSSLTLLILLPFSPIIALMIYVDSPGPIFYRQERVGKNGKIFKIIKFRTMIPNAEKETGPVWSQKRDPRITRVGNFLRKTRLDEIPQFINVLQGDMSLVGPRPERPIFVEEFIQTIPLYRHRLKMKPGITGWAQTMHKYDESVEDVKKKLEYDLYYLENMSLKLDLKIIMNTFATIFTAKGQ
ncbi:MAG: sugar transferase [Candidatus Marinimicrobia bacterium]|nr:sugar transferase [Candidatus Neomarinimicrobiota bacterium]